MPVYHVPVMLFEVLTYLQPQRGQVMVDCTVGGGGHAAEVVKRLLPDGKLIGIDRDDEALAMAADTLSEYRDNVLLLKGDFADIGSLLSDVGVKSVDGVLMDLGVSSHQLDAAERGFSFRADAPLDMRMDAGSGATAADLVNTLSEQDLIRIIRDYGEERWATRIAKFIVARRAKAKVRTTGDLVNIITSAVPAGVRAADTIHPATRTFQALRIAVNRELESLQEGLGASIHLLAQARRICILSYHSLEDRIVKDTFARYAGKCSCPPMLPVCVCGAEKVVRVLTKKPITATPEEVRTNPRARSAKLRAAEKLTKTL